MKGKIDKSGFLWKEVPGGKMVECVCVHDARPRVDEEVLSCAHDCVAFEGPLPETKDMHVGPFGQEVYSRPTGRTVIKICQGRVLVFDEFTDERVSK